MHQVKESDINKSCESLKLVFTRLLVNDIFQVLDTLRHENKKEKKMRKAILIMISLMCIYMPVSGQDNLGDVLNIMTGGGADGGQGGLGNDTIVKGCCGTDWRDLTSTIRLTSLTVRSGPVLPNTGMRLTG